MKPFQTSGSCIKAVYLIPSWNSIKNTFRNSVATIFKYAQKGKSDRMAITQFDYSRLIIKIEQYGGILAFADAMKMPYLPSKLCNKISWTQAEMNLACDLLGVPYEFIPILFFTKKV